MKPSYRLRVAGAFPEAIRQTGIPAHFRYRIASGVRSCWKHPRWTLAHTLLDAKHALVGWLEVDTKETLDIPYTVEWPDMHWVYQTHGSLKMELQHASQTRASWLGHAPQARASDQLQSRASGSRTSASGDEAGARLWRVPITIAEHEYLVAYAPLGSGVLHFEPGHHATCAFALNRDWLLRGHKPADEGQQLMMHYHGLLDRLSEGHGQCIATATMASGPGIDEQLQYLADISGAEGLELDVAAYRPIVKLIAISRRNLDGSSTTAHARTAPQAELVAAVKRYVETRIGDGDVPRVGELADTFHCSPETLRLAFVLETGKPLKEYIDACRDNESKRLLEAGMPIADVAYRFCNGDRSYFSRVYKKRFGHPPSQEG